MVQKFVTADLKGGKQKRIQVVATDIDKSTNEDEAFIIDHINLADSELHSEQSTGRRATTRKIYITNNNN